MKTYDAVIIGSGQAGSPLSRKLTKAGWKVALIEKRKVGGTCINDGCTPTKTMISSAKIANLVKRSSQYGIEVSQPGINIAKVLERKNKVVSMFRNSIEDSMVKDPNLDLIYGKARFSGKNKIAVDTLDGIPAELASDLIFINTGARPKIPDIPGIEKIKYYTSSSILDLDEIPGHLVILGAGYIAMELGQMYRRFGSEVTIIEQGSRLLLDEDEDIANEIENILVEDGISIFKNSSVQKMNRQENNQIELTIKFNRELKNISCSHFLIAAGRIPNTEELELTNCGIATDENGFIKTNEKLETSVRGIYALGDVKGGPAFTHISYNDYIIVSKNILEKASLSIKDRLVPYCMFIDPQLGRIGITEAQAIKQGLKIKVALLKMDHSSRGIETNNTRGMIKAIVDEQSKLILGAAVLAEEGGEVMSVLQMAIMGGITYEQVKDFIFAHPTYSESLNNLFMTLDSG
jgi:pyruvate/2-oxoglutarate dehydrogenase complex dihydrolipoamide dehydrogenase (E3) component